MKGVKILNSLHVTHACKTIKTTNVPVNCCSLLNTKRILYPIGVEHFSLKGNDRSCILCIKVNISEREKGEVIVTIIRLKRKIKLRTISSKIQSVRSKNFRNFHPPQETRTVRQHQKKINAQQ